MPVATRRTPVISLSNFLDNALYQELVQNLTLANAANDDVANPQLLVAANDDSYEPQASEVFTLSLQDASGPQGRQQGGRHPGRRQVAGRARLRGTGLCRRHVGAGEAGLHLPRRVHRRAPRHHSRQGARQAHRHRHLPVSGRGRLRRGADEVARLVIGIAARNDEHIQVITRLTNALDEPGLVDRLASTQDPQEFLDLLGAEQAA